MFGCNGQSCWTLGQPWSVATVQCILHIDIPFSGVCMNQQTLIDNCVGGTNCTRGTECT